MASHILIEPHYLGSLEFFSLLLGYDKITWEVCENFSKQTYKNRCLLLGSNGPIKLSIPTVHAGKIPYKDVKIDYQQTWLKDHKRAFTSSYGKSAYFDHFGYRVLDIWDKRHLFLLDLNMDIMSFCLELLHFDMDFTSTLTYEKVIENGPDDFRNVISSKKSFEKRDIYLPIDYYQTFGLEFVPNLSILDLLMCEGLNAREVLLKSRKNRKEQI